MKTAVVIPVGPGRRENLSMCLAHIVASRVRPRLVLLVMDGPEAEVDQEVLAEVRGQLPVGVVRAQKHHPGMEQPRNIGVRHLQRVNERISSKFTHVWFLDSDVIVDPGALEAFTAANGPANRILIGPYDWLPPGTREITPGLCNDPRWPSFKSNEKFKALVDDLSAGLACFSGNLVWPIDEFVRIGGFWNEIHHGRCEDGELGLRAVACGVPISFVGEARGWHLWHEVNTAETLRRNERDVPMLNERHPWVERRCTCGHQETDHSPDGARPCMACDCVNLRKEELFVVEEDGKRFDVRCPCGWSGNTAEIWTHQAQHG